MDEHGKSSEPLFDDMDGPNLVGLGNWLAESLDLSSLSNDQVLLLLLLLARALEALQKVHPESLSIITQIIADFKLDDDEWS